MATTHKDTGLRIEPGGLPAEMKRAGKTEADVNAFLAALDDESDRGLILTLGAILDDMCKEWLEEIFSAGTDGIRKELFSFNGPFGTFSGRTKALYCLGKLSEPLFKDINKLRELRNDAAHKWADFNFTNPKWRAKVEAMVSRIEMHDPDLDLKFRVKFHGWMLIVGVLGRGVQPDANPVV